MRILIPPRRRHRQPTPHIEERGIQLILQLRRLRHEKGRLRDISIIDGADDHVGEGNGAVLRWGDGEFSFVQGDEREGRGVHLRSGHHKGWWLDGGVWADGEEVSL